MKRWAALLKGVNVGGNRKLPMADLRALAEGLGWQGVKTLLASGNLLFTAAGSADALADALEAALAKHGCATRVVLRDHAALCATIEANPFPQAARDRPSHLLVAFHRDPVPAAPLEALAKAYDGPERIEAIGRDLFIDYPEGVGDSKLGGAMVKARFPALATARNWNTLLKLADLTRV